MAYEHIAIDHQVMAGGPVFKGLAYPLQLLLAWVADGLAADDIQANFPQLDHF